MNCRYSKAKVKGKIFGWQGTTRYVESAREGNFLPWFFCMCNIKKLMIAIGFAAIVMSLYTRCFTVHAFPTPLPS
jgi:hypothetical protein